MTLTDQTRSLAEQLRSALDFDPRLLVPKIDTVVNENEAGGRLPLDAIFISCRSRPQYVSELLSSLPRGVRVFLLPSSPRDVPAPNGHTMELLNTADPDFDYSLKQMRCNRGSLSLSFFGDWDLPRKRNYVLWYARRNGLRQVLLLDDDIRGINTSKLCAGARSLSDFSISGFFVNDYPDTSVMGHVSSAVGDYVSTFLSGSCLFVRTDADLAFFAPIYNEDWLFMLPEIAKGSVASIGCIEQVPYDPFTTPQRAIFQEPGDLIADGLFALFSCGRYEQRFQDSVWRDLIGFRMEWLRDLAVRTKLQSHRIAVEAAMTTSRQITATDCVDFVTDWETDRQFWTSRLKGLEQ